MPRTRIRRTSRRRRSRPWPANSTDAVGAWHRRLPLPVGRCLARRDCMTSRKASCAAVCRGSSPSLARKGSNSLATGTTPPRPRNCAGTRQGRGSPCSDFRLSERKGECPARSQRAGHGNHVTQKGLSGTARQVAPCTYAVPAVPDTTPGRARLVECARPLGRAGRAPSGANRQVFPN